MIETGFEIGAHSHSHVKVGQQEEQKALLEVELPKKILEEKLRMPVCSFAYPKGQYCSFSDLTRRLLMKSGYKAACTMLEGPLGKNADLMSLPRIGINGYDDINKFQMKLEGYFDCLRWLRVLRKKVF
jgi:peptidoglycan/xylan/chitin deacetylase (PgdA/CDA1 family)